VSVIDDAHDMQQGIGHLFLFRFSESLGIDSVLVAEIRRIEITLTREGRCRGNVAGPKVQAQVWARARQSK
jgi:hypothetical protein